MKIYTPDGTELMAVTAIRAQDQGILIEGLIMGAMPMKGIVQADQLRALRPMVTPNLVWTALKMMFLKAR
jgi:hypothetical protein